MPTYIGENKIVDRYLGDRFLEAAYIGDTKVYDPYTEITGTLPLIFHSRVAVALKNYRIYGTAGGSGTATGSGEPAGYKIPLTVTSGQQSTGCDLFIGNSKLGEEEYVDFREQKIYRNPFNWGYTIDTAVNPQKPDAKYVRYAFNCLMPTDTNIVYYGDVYIKQTVDELTVDTEGADVRRYVLTDEHRGIEGMFRIAVEDLGEGTTAVGFFQLADGSYIYSDMFSYTYDYVEANKPIKPPGSPFIYPTDPPASLPAISTYKGKNTLSSTETVGNVTVRGRIKELPVPPTPPFPEWFTVDLQRAVTEIEQYVETSVTGWKHNIFAIPNYNQVTRELLGCYIVMYEFAPSYVSSAMTLSRSGGSSSYTTLSLNGSFNTPGSNAHMVTLYYTISNDSFSVVNNKWINTNPNQMLITSWIAVPLPDDKPYWLELLSELPYTMTDST